MYQPALKIFLLSAIFFITQMVATPCLRCETRYVNDVLIISLRTGPGKNFKITKTLKTGAALTVLSDKGEFINVRTEDGIKGWVAKYYTNPELPKKTVIKQLRAKLQQKEIGLRRQQKINTLTSETRDKTEQELNGQLQKLSEIKRDYDQEITTLTEQRDEATKKYENILSQSANILETSEERDQLTQRNKKLSKKVSYLLTENNSLRNYKIIYWFLAGGGLLLTGWVLGAVSKHKKTRTLTL